jgi:hypothetical protein
VFRVLLASTSILVALGVVVAITLMMVVWPGWLAARVPPSMGLQE